MKAGGLSRSAADDIGELTDDQTLGANTRRGSLHCGFDIIVGLLATEQNQVAGSNNVSQLHFAVQHSLLEQLVALVGNDQTCHRTKLSLNGVQEVFCQMGFDVASYESRGCLERELAILPVFFHEMGIPV